VRDPHPVNFASPADPSSGMVAEQLLALGSQALTQALGSALGRNDPCFRARRQSNAQPSTFVAARARLTRSLGIPCVCSARWNLVQRSTQTPPRLPLPPLRARLPGNGQGDDGLPADAGVFRIGVAARRVLKWEVFVGDSRGRRYRLPIASQLRERQA
jgi:hypothetical protein